MSNEEVLKNLYIELREGIITLDRYIYIVRNDNEEIKYWYYSDSVESLIDFQNKMIESTKDCVSSNIKKDFDEYIDRFIKDKPFMIKIKVSDLIKRCQN